VPKWRSLARPKFCVTSVDLRLALTILEEFCRMYLGTGEHLQKPEKTVA
jgi:hypothetical protein